MKIALKYLDEDVYGTRGLDYMTPGAAAVDLAVTQLVEIGPHKTVMVGTGVAVSIGNPAVAGLILPRSGMGTDGLILANIVGLIDSDYQGEIKLALHNRNPDKTYFLERGTRAAQLVFVPIIIAQFARVEEFSETTWRGTGGFGSTGMQSGGSNEEPLCDAGAVPADHRGNVRRNHPNRARRSAGDPSWLCSVFG